MMPPSIFQDLAMEELTPVCFDSKLQEACESIVGVFFWGKDCPNCEVAKKVLIEYKTEFLGQGLKWYHVNTYEHHELGTRFGLHGIPTFLFFLKGRKLGKISPFPGFEPFRDAIDLLRRKHGRVDPSSVLKQ